MMPRNVLAAAGMCLASPALAATITLTPFSPAPLPATATRIALGFVDSKGDVVGTYYDTATGNTPNFTVSAAGAFAQIAAGDSITFMAPSGNYVGVGSAPSGQTCGIYSTAGLLSAPQSYCGSQAAPTYLFSINGAKAMAGQDGTTGFTLAKGKETLITAGPAGTTSAAISVIPAGVTVGSYMDQNFNSFGFVRARSGAVTVLTRADGTTLLPTGITGGGTIYGLLITNGAYTGQAYAYAGGTYTALNLPGAASSTVTGVSPAGRVVGTYTDASSTVTAYYRTKAGAIVSIPAPTNYITGNIVSVTDTGLFIYEALGFDDVPAYYIGKCAGKDC